MNDTANVKSDTSASADFDAIVEEIAALKSDFEALMGHMKSGVFKGTRDSANHALGQLGDRANHLYERVTAQGQRSAKAIARQVEEQPVMSLLIAFGVGLIAGRLLIR